MFNPTDEQIKSFLDECIGHYELKSIDRDPYNTGEENQEIEVEITTSWRTTYPDDPEDAEPFDVEDVITFYPDHIDFGNFPAGGSADNRLYSQWLLANGWHPDLADNPFLKNSRKVADAPKRDYESYYMLGVDISENHSLYLEDWMSDGPGFTDYTRANRYKNREDAKNAIDSTEGHIDPIYMKNLHILHVTAERLDPNGSNIVNSIETKIPYGGEST